MDLKGTGAILYDSQLNVLQLSDMLEDFQWWMEL